MLTDLCEYLASSWRVHALAGYPYHVAASTASDSSLELTNRNGVEINRLSHTRFPKSNRFGRAINMVSFTMAAVMSKNAVSDSDVIVTETDPFFLPIVGSRLKRQTGAKLVVYLQDIYPDIAVALGYANEGLITRTIRKRLLRAYLAADRIIVLDNDMKRRIEAWGVPQSKIAVVPNWVDCTAIQSIKSANPFREKHCQEDEFIVMHSGNMGLSQNLETVIDAVADPVLDDSTRLLLVGDGARRSFLQEYVVQQSAESRVNFIDYQPREKLSESLSAADLHVISIDERIKGCLVPSKLYGILASGTPVLAIVPQDSEISHLIRKERVGWTIAPGNPAEIRRVILEAKSMSPETRTAMQHRARQLAVSTYDASICMSQFERELRSILEPSVGESFEGIAEAESRNLEMDYQTSAFGTHSSCD